MKKVRFAILGLGVIGWRHVRSFAAARSRDFSLAAVAEVNPQIAAEARQRLDVPVFDDVDELFASGLCDAVLVATPHCWHPHLTIRAAEAGLHVLCEKPLAVTVGPARAMLQECDKHKVALGAMLQQRTGAMVRTMKRMIQTGRLGKVHRISQIYTKWYRTQAYYDSGDWRGTWDGEGGGVMVNQAPHALDIFQWLGGMPRRVMASLTTRIHDIEVENAAEAIFQYDDGCMGHFYVSTAHEPPIDRIEVFGDKGTLVAEDGRLRFARLESPLSRHIRTCKIAEADLAKIGATWQDVKLPRDPGGRHIEVIRAFARHILRGTEMVATGAEALNQLELANAVYLSGFENRPVELPVDAARIERLLTRLEKQRSRGKGKHIRKRADAALKKLLKNGR